MPSAMEVHAYELHDAYIVHSYIGEAHNAGALRRGGRWQGADTEQETGKTENNFGWPMDALSLLLIACASS